MDCCVCGQTKKVTIKIPRIGPVPPLVSRRHPARIAFMLQHLHPDKGHPMSWAKPLRDPFAQGGINLDLLAMRLEQDLNEATDEQ